MIHSDTGQPADLENRLRVSAMAVTEADRLYLEINRKLALGKFADILQDCILLCKIDSSPKRSRLVTSIAKLYLKKYDETIEELTQWLREFATHRVKRPRPFIWKTCRTSWRAAIFHQTKPQQSGSLERD